MSAAVSSLLTLKPGKRLLKTRTSVRELQSTIENTMSGISGQMQGLEISMERQVLESKLSVPETALSVLWSPEAPDEIVTQIRYSGTGR